MIRKRDDEDEESKEKEPEGIEIQHFYQATVDGAINDYSDADSRAATASDALAIAKMPDRVPFLPFA